MKFVRFVEFGGLNGGFNSGALRVVIRTAGKQICHQVAYLFRVDFLAPKDLQVGVDCLCVVAEFVINLSDEVQIRVWVLF